MKNLLKKIMCMSMCVFIAISILACNRNNNQTKEPVSLSMNDNAIEKAIANESSAEGYYRKKEEIKTGLNDICRIFEGEDSRIYYIEGITGKIKIASTDKTGNDLKNIEFSVPDKTYVYDLCADAMGNIYCRNVVDIGEKISIVKLSQSGEVLKETELEPNEDDVVKQMLLCDDKVVSLVDTELSIFDLELNRIFKMNVPSGGKSMIYVNDTLYMFYCKSDSEDELLMVMIDLDSEKIIEKDIDVLVNCNCLKKSTSFDFSYYFNDKIYGYNINDKTSTLIFDKNTSGVPGNFVDYVDIDDTHFIVALYNSSAYEVFMMGKSEKEVKNNGEKDIITIGTTYMPQEIKDYILENNANQDEYEVVVVDYKESEDDDYNAQIDKMSMDLISGNGPDIIYFYENEKNNENNFIAKNVFTDLSVLMEEDGDIKKEDFLDNIIKMHEVDGKIYTIPYRFYLDTCYMTESLYNEINQDVSMDNSDVIKSKVKNGLFNGFYNRERVLKSGLFMNASHFFDVAEGRCEFDSEEFIEFLENVKKYPKDETVDRIYENVALKNREYAFGEMYNINSFEVVEMLDEEIGEKIVITGFPVKGKGCSSIVEEGVFGITEQSEHKAEAWDFIKTFFDDDKQVNASGFPRFAVTKTALDKQAKNAQLPKDVKEEDIRVREDGTMPKIYDPISAERAEYVKEIITSTTDAYCFNIDIYNIVTEEVGPFFEGSKTAEECADAIQQRAKIYISEKQ